MRNRLKEKRKLREKGSEYALSKEDNEVQEHDYQFQIPDLELYIVNLLDPKENNRSDIGTSIVRQDLDGVRDRHIDIKLGDS